MTDQDSQDAAAVDAAIAATAELLERPGVVGVGRGATETGEACLVVMTAGPVAEGLAEELRERFDGLPVEIQDIGGPPFAYGAPEREASDIEPDCG